MLQAPISPRETGQAPLLTSGIFVEARAAHRPRFRLACACEVPGLGGPHRGPEGPRPAPPGHRATAALPRQHGRAARTPHGQRRSSRRTARCRSTARRPGREDPAGAVTPMTRRLRPCPSEDARGCSRSGHRAFRRPLRPSRRTFDHTEVRPRSAASSAEAGLATPPVPRAVPCGPKPARRSRWAPANRRATWTARPGVRRAEARLAAWPAALAPVCAPRSAPAPGAARAEARAPRGSGC
jgi:hypothetical protein